MNLFHPQIAATLAASICLAACVAPPAAPTIPVAPGPSKTLVMFGADQAACQQYGAAQISPAVAAANNQAVGGALLGAALGAGLGAGIGAASGGALGIIGNADGAPYAQESLQQQYDIMYGQCMAAHGARDDARQRGPVPVSASSCDAGKRGRQVAPGLAGIAARYGPKRSCSIGASRWSVPGGVPPAGSTDPKLTLNLQPLKSSRR
jgi:hypothetical protein